MRVFFGLFVCVCLYKCTDGGSAPFITPCQASDSTCLVSSAQAAVPVVAAGVPSLGISTLDPMYVERVSASHGGLDMDFRNTTVKGLRNCKVLGLRAANFPVPRVKAEQWLYFLHAVYTNMESTLICWLHPRRTAVFSNLTRVRRKVTKTFIDLQCSVVMGGHYTLGGRLLLLPIEGDGRYKIKIRDIVVKIVYDIEPRVVGGETYWHVASWRHAADVQTGVQFSFQNLFNGNQALSDMIHTVANDRWKEIFQEVAPPIVTAIVEQIVTETTKIFDLVPERELSLP